MADPALLYPEPISRRKILLISIVILCFKNYSLYNFPLTIIVQNLRVK
jgi:hypothetical protein